MRNILDSFLTNFVYDLLNKMIKNGVICRYLDDTRKWFRTYKIPDGKPENNFAFDGAYKDKAFADKIIAECYDQWKQLVNGECESKLAIENVSVDGSKAWFH